MLEGPCQKTSHFRLHSSNHILVKTATLKKKLFSHFENHVLAVVIAEDQLQREWRFDFRSLFCHAMTCHSRGGSVTDRIKL